MTLKIKKDHAYYAALFLIVLAFIAFLMIPLSRSIGRTRAQMAALRNETTISLLKFTGRNEKDILGYYRAGLVSQADMVSYTVGRINAKFKEKGVEILELNPAVIKNSSFVDLSFKISNDDFLPFLASLSEIGLPFNVDTVNIDQQEDKILVKMRLGF